ETIVPPLARAIHQTYSAIASPQATGIAMPQMPMPLTNSHTEATTSTSSRDSENRKPIHHHNGARGRNTVPAMSALSEVKVMLGCITGISLEWSAARVI